uniref:Uncharacterized protein n=2 Tax=Timema TaxID=61471 RepID=A0A7R9P160_9NEOP|nr:unnamed protein product [Timema bartmani]CAD7463904.1 unnamed protein product [Timema tahoe]
MDGPNANLKFKTLLQEHTISVTDNEASIRKELSNMSFEQLLQLKEELGTKVYNEAIFGASSMNDNNFKRANKNR